MDFFALYELVEALTRAREKFVGFLMNTKPTDKAYATLPTTEADTTIQMAYVAQQCLDSYAAAVGHALRRKDAPDRRVLEHTPGEVIFSKGQLVQIYRSDLDYTFKTERKLLLKWSNPQRIVSKNGNSYLLETLKGDPIQGTFSTRRLRRFIPQEGTKLVEEQRRVEDRLSTGRSGPGQALPALALIFEGRSGPGPGQGQARANPGPIYI